jgi:hypothetical protein
VSRQVGDLLANLFLGPVGRMQNADDRIGQERDNLQVAFALERYHRDNRTYPRALSALAPKYLKSVPGDRFSGKGLIYKPEGAGYLLYSVGDNGKDEKGRSYPYGDDLAVRMHLPKLKK